MFHGEPIQSMPSTDQSTECCAVIGQQLVEAEKLTNELKRLLVSNESAFEQEGVRKHLETLERWMESYRRGLSAARKISENGAGLLNEMRERLKLASDELNRLENEGGNPLSKEQAVQAEEFMMASKRIEKIMPDIQHIFDAIASAPEANELEEEFA